MNLILLKDETAGKGNGKLIRTRRDCRRRPRGCSGVSTRINWLYFEYFSFVFLAIHSKATFSGNCWALKNRCFYLNNINILCLSVSLPLISAPILRNQISIYYWGKQVDSTCALERQKFETSFSGAAVLCWGVEMNLLDVVLLMQCAMIYWAHSKKCLLQNKESNNVSCMDQVIYWLMIDTVHINEYDMVIFFLHFSYCKQILCAEQNQQ